MIIKVSNNLLRGPRPTSFKELQALGIKNVINLESGFYELTHNDRYEKEDGHDYGITEHDIPCSDITPPSNYQVQQVLAIIEASPGLVYMHCREGVDRTGFMTAAYRIQHDGWTYKDSVREMFLMGFHKWPYIWWVPFLKKYEVKK
jgi:protein tyrosine/serine phosphatase